MRELVLVGGGHAHVQVLRRFAMEPPPGLREVLSDFGPAEAATQALVPRRALTRIQASTAMPVMSRAMTTASWFSKTSNTVVER